jgi:hypothetical protein
MICLVNFAFYLILQWEITNLKPSDYSLENKSEPVIFRLTKLKTK